MNEIVASLIVIYYTESIYIFRNKGKMCESEAGKLAIKMIDIEHAEADIFTLYFRIMEIG
jgi:hypothetical protein